MVVSARMQGPSSNSRRGLQCAVLVAVASTLPFAGTLNSRPGRTYRLEFFAGPFQDDTGFGEGRDFLGFLDVTTDDNGNASFSATFPLASSVGLYVTATATDPDGNTSEFSAALLTNHPPEAADTVFYTSVNTPVLLDVLKHAEAVHNLLWRITISVLCAR